MNSPVCFLIDDDEDDREIFAIALESACGHCSLVTAKNGLDALRIVDEDAGFVPDFIFVDLNMPYISGIECLEKIKLYPHLSQVPVIIYTTSSYQKDIDDTQQLGASHFLVKPSGLGALIDILSGLFAKNDMPFYLNSDN